MSSKVAIIGAGAIGRWSAYFLAKEGYHVTLIDKGSLSDGCSFGNAGMIVPSHVIPLAAPGMISKGIRWMMNSKSPFYVRPRLNRELFQWGRLFLKSANDDHVHSSIKPLKELSLMSSELYKEIASVQAVFEYRSTGLLMAYQSDHVGKEEIKAAKIAEDAGLEVEYLSAEEVQGLEPNNKLKTSGGVLYKNDGLINPKLWMDGLYKLLNELNVRIIPESEVTGFEKEGSKIKAIQIGEELLKTDHLIIATGAWSSNLAKILGDSLPLLPGKGYSFSYENNAFKQPTILSEGKVAVSPFGSQVQFGGTMEITHTNDSKINRKRVQGILDTVQSFYPDVELPVPNTVWSGFRPCSPDGLPYIGRSNTVSNVIYATGHGMMGISMGPATGKLVSQLVNEKTLEINISKFNPGRFS